MKFRSFLFTGMILTLLMGCGDREGEDSGAGEEQQPATLVLATFNPSQELAAQVEIFNETHQDFAIEIKEYGYSLLTGESTLDAVKREIAAPGAGEQIEA